MDFNSWVLFSKARKVWVGRNHQTINIIILKDDSLSSDGLVKFYMGGTIIYFL